MNSVIDQQHELIAMRKRNGEDVIPMITDPLGKYWDQPDRYHITIWGPLADGIATMSLKTFNELAEYSSTVPTGSYDGKMWRACYGGRHFMRWYYGKDEQAQNIKYWTIPILIL